jgi:3-methyladenine DNA glycosylase/8-oxoguanine DNA glycosylase
MSKYTSYTQGQFLWNLRNTVWKKIGFGKITEMKMADTWEHVYSVSTKNKAVDIIVFSSVDVRSGKTREKGSDAVRLVLRWETKFGYIYKRLGKHYRLETLFQNMEKTIKEAQSNCFNLNGNDFQKEII